MASPAPNNKPGRRVKSTLVQPVLPALPLFPKLAKTKADTAKPKQKPPGPPLSEEASHEASVSSIDRTEGAGHDEASETASPVREAQSVSSVPQPTSHSAGNDNAKTPPQPSRLILESDSGATYVDNDKGLINEAAEANLPSSEPKGTHSPGPTVQLAHTDSSHQNGTSQSDTSVCSVDYAAYQPVETRGASINESQVWSEDANDNSQPTSSLAHDTPSWDYVSSAYHPQADAKNDVPEAGQANEGDLVEVNDATTQRTQWPPALSNGTVNPHLRPQSSDQFSFPPSGRHSSAGSTTPPQITSLSEHLLQLATSKLWADWVLVVHSSGLQLLAVYAHGIMLIRSMRLNQAMNRQVASQHGGNIINLYPPRSMLPHAFETALRFLYSDTVLSSEALFPRPPVSDSRIARGSTLDYLLSYWVSGIELGVEPVVTRSAHLLVELLDWDIAEATMKEAVELDSTCWRAGHQQAGVTLEYAAMALQLKQTVLNFLASHINPVTFKLDTSPSLSLLRSRFAAIEDNRARHNPALSSMVFGSMPSSADLSPSSPQSEIVRAVEETAASNILFNIDFDGISFFYRQLEAIHGAAATPFVAKVVEERESRRSKVVSSRTIPNKQRTANSETWDVAGYRELVDEAGLRRERVGFLLPAKSP
ncbi:hypothetical protein DV737_g3429, partial [Chaetothyriales sp. CBS 132003]